MNKIIITLLLLSVGVAANAQEKSHVLEIGYYNEKLLIRWAPKDYQTWQKSVQNGYTIQKIDFQELVDGSNNWLNLNDSTLKPYSLEKLKKTFGKDNQNAALAAQMLYGKTSVSSDGSLPEIIANNQAEQNNKLGFFLIASGKDFEVAKAVALGFEDKTFNKNKRYAYRLIANGLDTLYSSFDLSEFKSYGTDLPTVIIEEQEQQVELKWKIDTYPFWGYYLEVKNKKNSPWQKTTNTPIVQINSKNDSLNLGNFIIQSFAFEKNYEPKEFRIVGLNDFGVEIYGESFRAQGRDKTAPSAVEDVLAKGLDEKSIKITWQWNNKSKAADLKYFRIDRATTTDFYFTPYSELLPTKTREFIDTKAIRMGNNYYRIAAIDTAGNESYSVFTYGMVYDSIAPSAPINLIHKIDSNGVLKLTWDRPKDADVQGYRVYFSNYESHQYINLTGTPISKEEFTDTLNLNTLTKKAYYKVVALDYHYNHSAYSKPFVIDRPDKLKPQAPIFTSYLSDGNSILLKWTKSYSEDVNQLVLFRKKSNETKWIEIYRGRNLDSNQYKDVNLNRGEIYEYNVFAIDASGLKSESIKPLNIKVAPMQTLSEVSELKGRFNGNAIQLNWQFELKTEVYFVIFRSENGGNFEELDFVDNEFTYIDTRIKKGISYQYAIKAVARKGASGKMGKPIKVISN